MYRVSFKPSFVRQAKRLDGSLFERVMDKLELLKNRANHHLLKVHKFHGKLANCYSFSVDYDLRIIFQFDGPSEIILLSIGGHDMYKN